MTPTAGLACLAPVAVDNDRRIDRIDRLERRCNERDLLPTLGFAASATAGGPLAASPPERRRCLWCGLGLGTDPSPPPVPVPAPVPIRILHCCGAAHGDVVALGTAARKGMLKTAALHRQRQVADAALRQQLAALRGDPTVFPGHWYSAEPSASLSEVKSSNYVYRVSNLEQWRSMMGG